MDLREQFEKYDIITDETIARGIVYTWTAMVVADAKVEGTEIKALQDFAGTHTITQQFNKSGWLAQTVGEALNVYKTEGETALLAIIGEMLRSVNRDTKRMLLHSLENLACIDGSLCQQEVEMLHKLVREIDINIYDVLITSMIQIARLRNVKGN